MLVVALVARPAIPMGSISAFIFFSLLSGQCFTAYVPSTTLLLRIRNIARLVVRDASGRDLSFTRDAVEFRPGGVKETIQLRGPGELLVFLSSATFLRDSQVCPAQYTCILSLALL